MEIGEKLRILREARHLTLQDLAVAVDIHPVTLSQYERGTRSVPYDLPDKIAETLGLDPEVFRAREPWAMIEEARRRYDGVLAEVGGILSSARDTVPAPSSDQKTGAAHVAKTRPTVTNDFCSPDRIPAALKRSRILVTA